MSESLSAVSPRTRTLVGPDVRRRDTRIVLRDDPAELLHCGCREVSDGEVKKRGYRAQDRPFDRDERSLIANVSRLRDTQNRSRDPFLIALDIFRSRDLFWARFLEAVVTL